MLGWIKKFLGGDQTAIPADATVQRDELGRVVAVSSSVTLRQPYDGQTTLPNLVLSRSLAPDLIAACDWIYNQNLKLAEQYYIGLENHFDVDQETQTVTLVLPEGDKIEAFSQILGSFDPRDRSYKWGWANETVSPEMRRDAEMVRRLGEERSEPALTTPSLDVNFDDILPLLALAAQHTAADGVYRCVLQNHTSIFLSLRMKGLTIVERPSTPANDGATANGRALWNTALGWVRAHNCEMFSIDQAYQDRKEAHDDSFDELLDKKRAVYRKYWQRDDDYWQPCSFSWPSDYRSKQWNVALPHPAEGTLVAAIDPGGERLVYHVKPVGTELRIVDELLNWGDGLIWPISPSPSAWEMRATPAGQNVEDG